MNIDLTRSGVYLIILIVCCVLTFTLEDLMYNDAVATIGIITGAFTFKDISTQQQPNEYSQKVNPH